MGSVNQVDLGSIRAQFNDISLLVLYVIGKIDKLPN